MESLESRLVLSGDTTSALFSAAVAMTQVKSGLYARPVSTASVEARFPLSPNEATTISPATDLSAPAPYAPAQIRKAYGIDQLPYDGTGQTIAIVDAYNNPAIATDLANFSTRFGLPAANLVQVIPNGNGYAPTTTPGGTTPGYDSGWALETALDVEWAHAIAPQATILLVEAATADGQNLFNAVGYAAAHANQVSMSWGGTEFQGVSSLDSSFKNTSVSFFASSGDNGAEVEFPAVSPYVVGVGGTSLTIDTAGNKLAETAWSGSGGGTSTLVAKPTFQNGFQSGSYRGVPDVSYDADLSTGILVLDNGTYYQVGGTSAGAPQWAGLAALVNQGRAAKGLASIGTGLANGLNTALYDLAGGSSYTNTRGDFTDITSGSNGNAAKTGYDTVTGLGSPVANKLVPDLVAYGTTTAPTPAPVFALGDAGFETVAAGSGFYGFVSAPVGSPWTFSAGTGLSGNGSAITQGNPNAPQGQQVAFIQNQGAITQSVANWTAGNYTISFQAAQRGNYGSPNQVLQVLIDGTAVATIRPIGVGYATYTTPSFAVTAGTHIITLAGMATTGDNTALIDAVAVNKVTATPTMTLGDAGFETVAAGSGFYGFVSAPVGSPWTFSAGTGLSGNGSAITQGNPNAPQGQQVAFIQNQGAITQSVANWTAGNYTISFQAAQRGNYGSPNQVLQVLIDGTAVATIRPIGVGYATYTTPSFAVTAGTHIITLAGMATTGDNTALIDAVAVNKVTATPTMTLGDAGFETVAAGSGFYGFVSAPVGSPWTFSAGTGLSGNGSAITQGNPNAPQGQQVAFIQNQGAITQSVANWTAGNYTISFQAAQRGNYGSPNQVLQVLIDGTAVATIRPIGVGYATYTTPSFAVTAGTHIITLAGMATTGDNTALIDAVAVNKGAVGSA